MMNNNKIITISGLSACGKTTLLGKLRDRYGAFLVPSSSFLSADIAFFCRHRKSDAIMNILQRLKAVATGLIGAAGAGILLLSLTGQTEFTFHVSHFDFYALAIAIVSLFLLRRFKIGPVWLMGISAVTGIIFY